MLVGERGQNLIIMTCHKTTLATLFGNVSLPNHRWNCRKIRYLVSHVQLWKTFGNKKFYERSLLFEKETSKYFLQKKFTLQQFFFSWMWWTLLRKRLMFVSGGMLTSKCKRSLLHDANFHKSRQKLELV